MVPIRKKTAFYNLKLAFPDKTKREISKIIKGCYVNVLTVIAEFFYMKKFSRDDLFRIIKMTNIELIHEKLKLGKGIILISAHYGNWELTAYGVSQMFNKPFNVIVKEQANKKIDERINMIRSGKGNSMIDMKDARAVLSLLKENKIAAMLGDQSAPVENVKVNFFVKDVPTFEGAARFAIKTGAAVLFGVSQRNKDNTYSLTLHDIDTTKYKGSTEENIKALTQEHVELLIEYIKQRPDHWLWFHRRFKHLKQFD
ncbi:MAG: lysophospholipid acyltransferase family protein [Chlorobi bacterium]|nr:lysophospholipid acyltransferase family protein [Chlorobiota bacterium]